MGSAGFQIIYTQQSLVVYQYSHTDIFSYQNYQQNKGITKDHHSGYKVTTKQAHVVPNSTKLIPVPSQLITSDNRAVQVKVCQFLQSVSLKARCFRSCLALTINGVGEQEILTVTLSSSLQLHLVVASSYTTPFLSYREGFYSSF